MSSQADVAEARSLQLRSAGRTVWILGGVVAVTSIAISGFGHLDVWLAIVPGVLLVAGAALWGRSSSLKARATALRERELEIDTADAVGRSDDEDDLLFPR